MNSSNLNDLLFPYVNGELGEEDAKQVERRAAVDADFARELTLTRAAMRLMARRKPASPKPFFWTRFSARLDAEEAPRQAWLWVAKRLIPSMVMATLIGAFTLSYTQPGQTGSSASETDIFSFYDGEYGATETEDETDTSILDSILVNPDERNE